MDVDFIYQQIYTIFYSRIHRAHGVQKSSSFVDISNFSKTKGLSGNQALNKNSTNNKKQKTMPIQFRTEKNNLKRCLAIE